MTDGEVQIRSVEREIEPYVGTFLARLQLAEAPEMRDAAGQVVHTRFLSRLSSNERSTEVDLRQFGGALSWLFSHGLLSPYKLAPVVEIPLTEGRSMLVFYGYSRRTKGQLNLALGFEGFREEGELGLAWQW